MWYIYWTKWLQNLRSEDYVTFVDVVFSLVEEVHESNFVMVVRLAVLLGWWYIAGWMKCPASDAGWPTKHAPEFKKQHLIHFAANFLVLSST